MWLWPIIYSNSDINNYATCFCLSFVTPCYCAIDLTLKFSCADSDTEGQKSRVPQATGHPLFQALMHNIKRHSNSNMFKCMELLLLF